MSSTIKKVIKVSYEQYHDLLTKGKTIDKDGNEHLYDDTASYNVYGYDELMTLNNKIDKMIIDLIILIGQVLKMNVQIYNQQITNTCQMEANYHLLP